jgi:hypothetical protein
MKKEALTFETDSKGTIRYHNAEGQLHNENGPAIVFVDGYKAYWINGKLHNPNGPAVVYPNGGKAYLINGERHNPNGPAIVRPNGSKAYYINDKKLTEVEFTAWQAQQDAPLHNETKIIDGVEYTLTENNS